MTALIVLAVGVLWVVGLIWALCILSAGAQADELIRRACAPPQVPDEWSRRAAWLTSTGELRVGPLCIARILGGRLEYPEGGMTIVARNIWEATDIAARLEADAAPPRPAPPRPSQSQDPGLQA
jgi:hypothetical protein